MTSPLTPHAKAKLLVTVLPLGDMPAVGMASGAREAAARLPKRVTGPLMKNGRFLPVAATNACW